MSDEYTDAMNRAYDHINELQDSGGSIQVTIDNIDYYFVADFGQSIGFLAVSTYNEKYRNNAAYLDENNRNEKTGWLQDEDYYYVPNGDKRLLNIYQQLAKNQTQEDIMIYF